jgi:hypothetical protein
VQWVDTDATPDEIVAPAVTALAIKGGFSVDVITNELGKLTAGTITDSDVRSGGNIGIVKAGSIIGSRLYAGVRQDVDDLPDGLDDFATASTSIKSVTVTGRSTGAFGDSRIAAGSVGKLSLGTLAAGVNDGAAFGVAGDSIASVNAVVAGQRVRSRGLSLPGDSTDVNDFELRLFL